jgi:acetyl coenzyme A synthetase (ADP forming)-like protein
MLDSLFRPQSVAVIGASRNPAKLGHGILKNIIDSGFGGAIYPVNPTAEEILGHQCYPSVSDLPGEVDQVVIVIPSRLVAQVLEECGQKGAKAAVIITAGFREVGGKGLRMEHELAEIGRRYGMRLLGPNCLGVINTFTPLNSAFAGAMPAQGTIAFMSQSGALCASVLDVALAEEVGFSSFVSLGNKADLNEIDLIEAWMDDPNTSVIMAYLEGIAEGSRFMEVARRATKRLPVIAIKSGTTPAGSRAVSSHTGTLAGSEQAYETAFKQAGIIRAHSVEELFDFSIGFSRQPLLRENCLAIVTNAGGPGIMCTDACEHAGLHLASLGPQTTASLQAGLPAEASVLNPIDVLGDAQADRYELAVRTALKDPVVSGLIVLLTPQNVTPIEEVARVIGEIAAEEEEKPILACFIGRETTDAGVEILNQYGVPNYPTPERAVGAMRAMLDQRLWQELPERRPTVFEVDKPKVEKLFADVRAEGRVTIGDAEARTILEAYGIPVPSSRLAQTPDEAVAFAQEIGYPVAMKIASPDILHKTDIGGVRLNIENDEEVRDAFDLLVYRSTRYMAEAEIWGCLVQDMVTGGREVILGMNRDPQFGPLLMFGLGGIYVEVLRDVTFRLAPLGREDVQEMITEIRGYPLLRGVRGQRAVDMEGIINTLLRISQLVTDFPEVVELDINPLLVRDEGQGVVAIDMRLVLSL